MKLKLDTPKIKQMAPDAVALEESMRLRQEWLFELTEPRTQADIMRLVKKHVQGVPCDLCKPYSGASSDTFRANFLGCTILVRFPKCGSLAMFPEEAVRNEAAVLRYLQANTGIPVPFVNYHGTAEEGLPFLRSPFLILDYMIHTGSLADTLRLATESLGRGKGHEEELGNKTADPKVGSDTLEAVYGEMANVLLHLSRAAFEAIGALDQVNGNDDNEEEETWEVRYRPLTMQMNQLTHVGSLPRARLPGPETTFATSTDYFSHLADLHLAHLRSQRNSAIDCAADCRRKFVARRLFQRLASADRLADPALRYGPFPLWCDELAPRHALTNGDGRVAAIIDWKHTYAAPAEFAHAPPWWLLLTEPEDWAGGFEAWEDAYAPRLELFLRVLREREDAAFADGWLPGEGEEPRLSDRMSASWETGGFWLAYAARKSFAFDWIYWHKLDQRFFGPLPPGVGPEDAWRERLHMLDEADFAEMDELVLAKLEEMKTCELKWEPEEVWPLNIEQTVEVASNGDTS
ncbi:Protein kinase-like domain protein [Cordyceps fumosorosea ARSEF 2679]|uniref:Protein kinase-like domain protein n=1 Tax=Cordyceps fumosorosea (strain ARSEF 2679) TaxID=1081104 RepID=A0A162JCD2_CORFA|nr:Protein kinase-like domain protein [Cordyceps fumosorosea ARSEF 2679]OAA40243.1 Protein kinase-like domain protein [Cordyceps fumosorosea ARSEF 2679]